MSISTLLTDLDQQGIKLWDDSGKLRIHAPKGSLTDQLKAELATRKAEILDYLRQDESAAASDLVGSDLFTIGYLIGGCTKKAATAPTPPIIEPEKMAATLRVTLKPLPKGYNNQTVLDFREQLAQKLSGVGVQVVPWESATRDFKYDIELPIDLPFVTWKKASTMRVVKTDINAVIDVEKQPSWLDRTKSCAAEKVYQLYSRLFAGNKKISVLGITKLIGWAEDYAIQRIEDPTNTQVITLTELEDTAADPDVPYRKKIVQGVNALVSTFSEIVIAVQPSRFSIVNMNLSDSVFSIDELDSFILGSLVPKIYVPIVPLPISRFKVDRYQPTASRYAEELIRLSSALASTDLFPSGFSIGKVVKRKSHRDIVNLLVDGRTGISYGFVAYIEPPVYVGATEISAEEWGELAPVEMVSSNRLRQNALGRRYMKTTVAGKAVFKQLPDVWFVSSRSGSNKTCLNLETDVLRIGLTSGLELQIPESIGPELEVKPSYDVYVMAAIALSTALYAPHMLADDGAPLIHFHGYPAADWFQSNERCTGVSNPSVPCGTYESGVLNFLGLRSLAEQETRDIDLICLVEPDHGANFIARDVDYLLKRVSEGIQQGDIELGGKHFPSLKRAMPMTSLSAGL